MYKIVIAPDKFKGSLKGIEFCKIVAEELHRGLPSAQIIQLPLADGGDGTASILAHYSDTQAIKIEAHNPLFLKVESSYYYSQAKNTAYIDMASVSGLSLLNKDEYNPMLTTTYGTGELIADAIERGAKHIVLGIGGSATNDAGIGVARALGYQFLDKDGNPLKGIGADLNKIQKISSKNVHPKLFSTKITVACDVTAPLFGKNGASYVYAPQKGADSAMVATLDEGLRHFNKIVKQHFNIDVSQMKGAGAAGGLGAGAMLFLNAKLKSGIAIVKREAKFSEQIKNADWIISGEGSMDAQTFQGKVIKGVLDEISTQKVALFCGQNQLTKQEVANYTKICYIDEILAYSQSQDDAIINAKKYLKEMTKRFLEYQL
ncbi:glycerate kinase [Balneicella halophila]|uniref:Glycerate kinase n=1 Tax=Balneicella halophila TaxID=1537566 RepID=A0A7L4UQM4_BALHA|nr:glycerate kinase [Balneicella halophila]PVX51812.1 glycerate kinase [Balneicella halophila]